MNTEKQNYYTNDCYEDENNNTPHDKSNDRYAKLYQNENTVALSHQYDDPTFMSPQYDKVASPTYSNKALPNSPEYDDIASQFPEYHDNALAAPLQYDNTSSQKDQRYTQLIDAPITQMYSPIQNDLPDPQRGLQPQAQSPRYNCISSQENTHISDVTLHKRRPPRNDTSLSHVQSPVYTNMEDSVQGQMGAFTTFANDNLAKGPDDSRYPCRFMIVVCLAVIVVAIITGTITFFVAKRYTDDGQQCSWTMWSSWTSCSVTCGNGTSYRLKQYTGEDECSLEDDVIESTPCVSSDCINDRHQCSWTAWTHWTPCSTTCGKGTSLRIKQYSGEAEHNCTNDEFTESRPCNLTACINCFWTSWSFWTSCSATCDIGTQYRIKQYLGQGNDSGCERQEKQDTKTCLNNKTCIEKDSEIIEMKFDNTTTHRFLFISEDEKTISDEDTAETPNSHDGRLKVYRGVMANFCVRDNHIVYYEVEYNYTIVTNPSFSSLVFEVGLAELERTDNSFFVFDEKIKGWSFIMYKNNKINAIVLQARDFNGEYRLKTISYVSIGLVKSGKLAFLVDRLNNRFIMYINSSIFHTFDGVVSTSVLCPMFGGMGSVANTKLRILRARNFTSFPFFSI